MKTMDDVYRMYKYGTEQLEKIMELEDHESCDKCKTCGDCECGCWKEKGEASNEPQPTSETLP